MLEQHDVHFCWVGLAALVSVGLLWLLLVRLDSGTFVLFDVLCSLLLCLSCDGWLDR